MKVCLIGQNLTNLILSLVFVEKKLNVDLYINNKNRNIKTNRTIAISKDNFDYIKSLVKTHLPHWKTKEIKIYIETKKKKESINFKNKNRETFNLLNYSKLKDILYKKIKKNKSINIIKQNPFQSNLINKIKKYDLVINSEINNIISKKYFTNRIFKKYESCAYTFVINHKKINNTNAIQIFTKNGPLAFLPISNTKTSIVFSYEGKEINNNDFLKLFKKYNSFYKINKVTDIEKFNLGFMMLRNYTHNNILAFGDVIHRIHPLAGQGFNMTIRDIKILAGIIDSRISLGLPIDSSVGNDFQMSTKHLNYLYGKAIDGIYEFFKVDNDLDNLISKPLLSILNKNHMFKKFSNIISDKGLYL